MRWRTLGPALAVAVAVVAALALTRDHGGEASPATTRPAPVAVASDAPRAATLEDLAAGADLVVRGEVVRTARGRLFGDPASGTAIESRLVTLSVTTVLRGEVGPGDDLLVEEEGWTQDGAPLIVDGASPSAAGDDGIWFLTAVEGPAGPAYVVVSAQGRYLVEGGGLRGADGDDPLIAALSALSATELTRRIAALPG